MRFKNVIIGFSVAVFAFLGLILLVDQKGPEFIKWYCNGKPDNSPMDVDFCIESHPNLISFWTNRTQ